ncbi:hypothetical protein HBI24_202190 [Parastagonospora nodorum]|nr:hypothetical protein HBI02_215870 [Parastagonospora nodorum]KAH4292284.1 hypothetical protein HBI01_184590 [Parastagonospora nodorum]KAH4323580.1 hypothetical protein HBI00_182320 [Parastagonospora nodorum]KAH4356710.1 hypothetical protein HBH94_227920 [Parastagonospora nodorum]KAH4445316.1 hypothetical protein HBH90_215830 [Parastagonospora nodorum]
MDTPMRDGISPETVRSRDTATPASDVTDPRPHHPTPSSGGSSRAPTPENDPVTELQAESGPAGRSQQEVKHKGKKPLTKSELFGHLEITFLRPEERMRAQDQSKRPPQHVFRSFHEKSATLSAFVSEDCHLLHADVPHLKLEDDMAFKNHGDYDPLQDLTPERIRRQYKGNKALDPSPFVSFWETIEAAEGEAKKSYTKSRKGIRRVAVGKASISNLIPATVRGQLRTRGIDYVGNNLLATDRSIKTRRVRLPVWVRPEARPADGSPISFQQLEDSGTDMWVRGSEMAMKGPFDMQNGVGAEHDDEWLCCGPVPKSCIDGVFPFDGETLHLEKSCDMVESLMSIEKYLFDWDMSRWRHNPDITDWRPFRLEIVGDKRRHSVNNDDEDEAAGQDLEHVGIRDASQPRSKRAQHIRLQREPVLEFSKIVTIADITPEPIGFMTAAAS